MQFALFYGTLARSARFQETLEQPALVFLICSIISKTCVICSIQILDLRSLCDCLQHYRTRSLQSIHLYETDIEVKDQSIDHDQRCPVGDVSTEEVNGDVERTMVSRLCSPSSQNAIFVMKSFVQKKEIAAAEPINEAIFPIRHHYFIFYYQQQIEASTLSLAIATDPSNTKISVEYLRGISSIRYDEATDAENTNGRYNVHKVDNTVC
uniref:ADF-H domain-containing protein n=1 Tax=Ascaris lumbricoides TaxID=6252 RepID=A0A9J2Q4P1_ASCLU